MGCSDSKVDVKQVEQNQEIERTLKRDKRAFNAETRLLLLGAGESGKSTFFKQIQLLSSADESFSDEQRAEWRPAVLRNVLANMIILLQRVRDEDSVTNAWSDFAELDAARFIVRQDVIIINKQIPEQWNVDIERALLTLWRQPLVRTTLPKCYQLSDSALYFFERMSDIFADGYVPSTQDVLRVRVKTTAICESTFEYANWRFKLMDVGGQRNERKKWIHCFDSVTAVLYWIDASGYDKVMAEDGTSNRMLESLTLFEGVANSPWFWDTPFILFFNKQDLFRDKIERVDLSCAFPDYTGGCNYDAASEYITKQFFAANVAPHQVYAQYTTAIDTKNIRTVFVSVRDTVLRRALNEFH